MIPKSVCFYRPAMNKVRRKSGRAKVVDLTDEQEDMRLAFGATRQDILDLTGDDVLNLIGEVQIPALQVQTKVPSLPAGAGVFLSNWVGMEHEIVLRSTEPRYQSDADSLRPDTWLNDGAINWYMHLLYISRRNPLFKVYPHSSFTFELMRREHANNELNNYKKYLRYAKGVVLSECDRLFFPIHKPGHWCLVVGYPKEDELAYYDPIGKQDAYSDLCLEILEGYLRARGRAFEAETCLNKKWNRVFVGPDTAPVCIPRQTDTHSCGLFLCALADVLCAGPGRPCSWGYSQTDMTMLRTLMRWLITPT